MARKEPARFQVFNSCQPLAEVAEEVLRAVDHLHAGQALAPAKRPTSPFHHQNIPD
jgi:hypothetical protein